MSLSNESRRTLNTSIIDEYPNTGREAFLVDHKALGVADWGKKLADLRRE